MKQRTLVLLALVGVLLGAVSPAHAGRTEDFVRGLFRRFAYREATPPEVEYWADVTQRMQPEQAERRLKHWFFVHAAYKTSLGRTVTIFEVERTVDLLDAGRIDMRAVQFAIFRSPEYKRAKERGLAGTMMVPLPTNPS